MTEAESLAAIGGGSTIRMHVSKLRAGYVLLIMSLITVCNYYDRNLISILVEDLKVDLKLSDAQIGVLSGLAFALVYSMVALPIARFADGGRRVRVLGGALAVWSAMTALCGLAGGFGTMLFARLGVGVGEAGGAPTIHAIVAETFSPRRRAAAFGIIGLSGGIGLVGAYAIGGYLAEHYGWRTAFMLSSVPGILTVFVLLFTVREPTTAPLPAGEARPSLWDALKILGRRRSFVWVCGGMAIAGIGAFGSMAWIPTFLMRHYQFGAARIGADYSAATGPGTLLGIFIGGFIGDWLAKRDERWSVWLLAISFAVGIPLMIAFLTVDNYQQAMFLSAPMSFIGIIWTAPSYALIQNLSGPRLRATGASVFMLVVNIVGQGLGPLVIGWISDRLTPHYGRDSLCYALLAVSSTSVVGTVAFIVAGRFVRADIIKANEASLPS